MTALTKSYYQGDTGGELLDQTIGECLDNTGIRSAVGGSDLREDWQGDALITGLKSQAIIRVRIEGDTAEEVQRFELGARIRDIAKT